MANKTIGPKLVKEVYGTIVGGYENAVTDKELESMPSTKEMFNEIMNNDDVKKVIKKHGKETVKDFVLKLLKKDGYGIEINKQVHNMDKEGTPTKLYKAKYGTAPTKDFREKFGYFNKNEYAKWLVSMVKTA